jgi:hypothetical protein
VYVLGSGKVGDVDGALAGHAFKDALDISHLNFIENNINLYYS